MEMMVTGPDEIAKRKNNIIVIDLPEMESFDGRTLFDLLIETMNMEPNLEPKHIRRLGDNRRGPQRYMKTFLQSSEDKDMII